jgi:hypothetical protein
MKKYPTHQLKDWCKSMIDAYAEEFSIEDELYIQLNQFYNENRVNGIFHSKSKQEKKNEWLETTAKK